MKSQITKEYLETKWWHRLAKVLIYLISFCVSIFLLLSPHFYSNNFFESIIAIIFLSVLAYILFYLLSIIYYKIILYIIYGKNKNIFPYSFLPFIIIAIFFTVILAALSLMDEAGNFPVADYIDDEDSFLDDDFIFDFDLDL